MKTILDLINDPEVLFVANHSGGKDSQATLIEMLEQQIPADRIVVIHADLGEVEWHGAKEIAERDAKHFGCQFEVATAIYNDGSEKTLLNMIEKKFAEKPEVPSWPSPSCRSCTSDLKRGPIEKVIRRVMKERGVSKVVNCAGMRAAESDDRAKLEPFVYENENLNSKGQPKSKLVAAGRQVWSWLPIFDLSTDDVFATVIDAGIELHPAYAAGNERLSCVFCIMGSKNDLYLGSIARPELYAKYLKLEAETGYTMHMDRIPLSQLVAEGQREFEAKREAA